MKTLKQIREEYNKKFSIEEDNSIDEIVLDEAKMKLSTGIPSSKEMPVLLMFRRIQYRIYPDKQVVALYYSRMVDKYLSIPFGPKGNLNLSEAVIYDNLESVEEGTTWETLKGAAQGAIAGRAGGLAGMAAGAVAGGSKGYIKGKYDELKAKMRQKKTQSKKDDTESGSSSSSDSNLGIKPIGGFKRPIGHIKTGSSWSSSSKGDAVYQSRMKSAAAKEARQASVQENKISDLRKMIKEDMDNMELSINGRQVTLNTSMAKRILEVYDSVNTRNKKIVEGMLNEDLESFKRLLNFSIRN